MVLSCCDTSEEQSTPITGKAPPVHPYQKLVAQDVELKQERSNNTTSRLGLVGAAVQDTIYLYDDFVDQEGHLTDNNGRRRMRRRLLLELTEDFTTSTLERIIGKMMIPMQVADGDAKFYDKYLRVKPVER